MFRAVLMILGLGLLFLGKVLQTREMIRFQNTYSQSFDWLSRDLMITAMYLHCAVSAGCYSVQLLGFVFIALGVLGISVGI